MERKKAGDFPPEVLKLFDGYVHGAISRREFLDRASKFAVGAFTATAMLESLQPNFAWAQQVPKDDKRIKTGYADYDSPNGSGKMRGYLAQPASAGGKLPAVLVIHENRGLIRTPRMSRGGWRWRTSWHSRRIRWRRWAAIPATKTRRVRCLRRRT